MLCFAFVTPEHPGLVPDRDRCGVRLRPRQHDRAVDHPDDAGHPAGTLRLWLGRAEHRPAGRRGVRRRHPVLRGRHRVQQQHQPAAGRQGPAAGGAAPRPPIPSAAPTRSPIGWRPPGTSRRRRSISYGRSPTSRSCRPCTRRRSSPPACCSSRSWSSCSGSRPRPRRLPGPAPDRAQRPMPARRSPTRRARCTWSTRPATSCPSPISAPAIACRHTCRSRRPTGGMPPSPTRTVRRTVAATDKTEKSTAGAVPTAVIVTDCADP